jgi:hypothetical protein
MQLRQGKFIQDVHFNLIGNDYKSFMNESNAKFFFATEPEKKIIIISCPKNLKFDYKIKKK